MFGMHLSISNMLNTMHVKTGVENLQDGVKITVSHDHLIYS